MYPKPDFDLEQLNLLSQCLDHRRVFTITSLCGAGDPTTGP